MRRLHDAKVCLAEALDRLNPLSDAAIAALDPLCSDAESYAYDTDVPTPVGRHRATLVLFGWIAEQITLADGRRQILRLRVPGEICGMREEPADSMTQFHALTDVIVADVSRLALAVRRGQVDASLAEAWRRMEVTHHAADLRHIVRLGRLSARERTGQLLVELYERLSLAGLTQGSAMPMPLTQLQLADHLGLSVVHVNRVLQQFKREGFTEPRPRQLMLRKLAELAQLSHYELGAYPGAQRLAPPPVVRSGVS